MNGRRWAIVGVCVLLVLSVIGLVGVMSDADTERTARQADTAQGATAGATPIDGCREINAPGRYVLTRNVTNDQTTRTTQNCVWINASNVVLDGNGHRLDGIGVSDSTGVAVTSPASQANVTIYDLAVSDWHTGVAYRGVAGGTVRNVSARENALGIDFTNTSNAAALDNAATNNLIGLRVRNSTLAALSGTNATANIGTGIDDELTTLSAGGRAVTVGPPLDPDDDGRYEDVTGDGTVDTGDVVTLFSLVSTDAVGGTDLRADHRRMLDIDGSGEFDYGDVWALFDQ